MTAGSLSSCVFLLLFSSIRSLWATEISCKSEDGNPVDWFLLYKLPKYIRKASPGTGLEYMYMDSLTQAWQLSKFLINMTQSALGQTLNQLYEAYKSKNDSTAYVIYNDDVPHSKHYSWKQGHTKGFLLLDKSQGFWGIHSIPLFPPFPEEGYGYPPTGKQNAQMAICITFRYNQFAEIDIYVAWMAQQLQTDLLAESWQHDGQELPSNCSLQHHVYNINLIKTPWNSTFSSYYDHSKWCVSWRYEDQWTCIGDLNRAPQQAWRSGGFICTQNPYIYKAFRHMISHYHSCNNSRRWI
nr:deoxyribonuclease-2-beta isoform X2 [Chrysemys picta bellii]